MQAAPWLGMQHRRVIPHHARGGTNSRASLFGALSLSLAIVAFTAIWLAFSSSTASFYAKEPPGYLKDFRNFPSSRVKKSPSVDDATLVSSIKGSGLLESSLAPWTALDCTDKFISCRLEKCIEANECLAVHACAALKSAVVNKSACRVPASSSSSSSLSALSIFIPSPIPEFLRQAIGQLAIDPSFIVGSGVTLSQTFDPSTASLILAVNPTLSQTPCDPATELYVVTINLQNSTTEWNQIASANLVSNDSTLVYGSLRSSIGQLLAENILPKPTVRLCVLLVWAGAKPPPARMIDVARSFMRAGAFSVLVFVEGEHVEKLKSFVQPTESPGIVVVDSIPNGNLTFYLHSRVDNLIPELKGHEHYALGWGLCDFRWLFGDIFANFLPPNRFTHWAWADSDAFASSALLGPLTDYGRDFERHDVVSFPSFGTGKVRLFFIFLLK